MAPLWVQQVMSLFPLTIIGPLSLLIFSLLLAVLPLAFLHFPRPHTVSVCFPCPAHYSTHPTTPYTLLVHLKPVIQPTLSQCNTANFPSCLLLTTLKREAATYCNSSKINYQPLDCYVPENCNCH